jgi:uncharacterized protein (TIGR02270 family)
VAETLHLDDAILWDVIDEHLDEAEFGLEQLERVFISPVHTLHEIARYPEERLLAHIDGLVVGGQPVLVQRLVPTLEDTEPSSTARITAAALALIQSGSHERLQVALQNPASGVARAAMRACELGNHAKIAAWARDRLAEPQSPEALAALLEYVAASHLPAPPQLMQCLQSDSVLIVRAATHAAMGGDPAHYLAVIEHLLEHADAEARDAAVIAALAWGSQRAWSACERLALDQTAPQSAAMLLYAALGGRAQHDKLAGQLQNPTARRSALFALGHTGNVRLVPLLLEQLTVKDPVEVKLAAQALSTILGIDLQNDSFAAPAKPAQAATHLPPVAEDAEAQAALPPLEQDDLEADLVPAPEDALPTPDAAAITKFWAEAQARFDSSQRYLGGAPFDLDSALDYLTQTPGRRRQAIATELLVRSTGKLRVNTRLFTTTQHTEIAAARQAAHVTLRAYSRW